MKFFVAIAALAVVVSARPDISLVDYDNKGFNQGTSGFNTFSTSPVIKTSYQQPASGVLFSAGPTQQTFGSTTLRGSSGFSGPTYSTGYVSPVAVTTTRGGFGDIGFGSSGYSTSGSGSFGAQQAYAAPTVTTTQVRGGFGNSGFGSSGFGSSGFGNSGFSSGSGNFGAQQAYVVPTVSNTFVRGGNTGFSSGGASFGGQQSYVAPVQTVTTTQLRGGNTGFSSGNTGFSSGNTGFSSGSTGFSSGNTGFSSGSGLRSTGSGFGSGQTVYSGSQGQSGFSQGSSGRHRQKTVFVQQKPIITKHFYVHAAPEEEEEYHEARQVQLPAPQKHYKIVFIKAPTYSSHRSQIIAQQAQSEEKTLIYVLVKKPEDTDDVDIQTAKAAPPSKPEVFFIKYKGNDAHKKIQQTLKETEIRFGGGANQGTTVVSGGQQAFDAITNNDLVKSSITSMTKQVGGEYDNGFDFAALAQGDAGSSFTSGNTGSSFSSGNTGSSFSTGSAGSSGSSLESSSVGTDSRFGGDFVSQDFGVIPTGATLVSSTSSPVSGYSSQYDAQDFGSVQGTGATIVSSSSAPLSGFSSQFVGQDFGSVQPTGATFVTTSSAPAFVTSSVSPTFVADNSVDTRFAASSTTGSDNIGFAGGETKFATVQEPPSNYGPPNFQSGQLFKRASKQ